MISFQIKAQKGERNNGSAKKIFFFFFFAVFFAVLSQKMIIFSLWSLVAFPLVTTPYFRERKVCNQRRFHVVSDFCQNYYKRHIFSTWRFHRSFLFLILWKSWLYLFPVKRFQWNLIKNSPKQKNPSYLQCFQLSADCFKKVGNSNRECRRTSFTVESTC